MEEGFQIVSNRRKKGKNRKIQKKDLSSHDLNGSGKEDESWERAISIIETCRREIKSDGFWDDFTDSLQKDIEKEFQVEDIISYGAGHIATNPTARYQFAFLILLAQHFQLSDRVYIYDPVFTLAERNIIKHFGFQLITHNEECRRQIARPAFVFMMHCGKAMYNNLLHANWNRTQLTNLVIIGNSFSSYAERVPSRSLKAEAPYLSDIFPYAEETPVANTFIHKDIFNDTAMVRFPSKSLPVASCEFWTLERTQLKVDNDTEIVTKSKIETFET